MPAFPYKLHNLMEEVSKDDTLSAIISWLPDGKSFRIHAPEIFEQRLLQKYFPRQTQIKSFKRQLQYYNFENFGDGLFSHPCFRRGQKNLCGQIIHMLPTKSQKAGGSTRAPRAPKPRGRKKKMKALELRQSSLTNVGSSAESLKSRIPNAASAAGEDESTVSSVITCGTAPISATSRDENTLSSPQLSPKAYYKEMNKKNTNDLVGIPKCIGSQDQAEMTHSKAIPLAIDSMVSRPGGYAASAILSASHHPYILLQQQRQQQALAQLHHMQTVEMARQNHLACLQRDIMLGSLVQSGSSNSGAYPQPLQHQLRVLLPQRYLSQPLQVASIDNIMPRV